MILGLADTFNTLAILFMGKNRVELYTEVIQTEELPIRTAWQCALEPWLILRGIGKGFYFIFAFYFIILQETSGLQLCKW